jgi:redox-sensing transcriptional repressor
MGILATAATEAQGVANTMVQGGIMAILNFTPVDVYVPEKVKLVNNILTMEMQMLACCLDTAVK